MSRVGETATRLSSAFEEKGEGRFFFPFFLDELQKHLARWRSRVKVRFKIPTLATKCAAVVP